MTTNDQRRAMIDQIRRLPALVRETINGMNDVQLDTPYGPGKWTARQVVHHLADSHMNGYARMKLLLTEDTPTIKTYKQEAWAETPDVLSLPVEPSIDIIDGLHQRWATLFASLKDEDFARKGNHPEHGEITVEWILRIYAAHGEKHMKSIADLRKSNGW